MPGKEFPTLDHPSGDHLGHFDDGREMIFPTAVAPGGDPREWVPSHQSIISLEPKQWASGPRQRVRRQQGEVQL